MREDAREDVREGVEETKLRTWHAPAPGDVSPDFEHFLDQLGGPVWIVQPGAEPGRARAVSTLLHGNEPSGLRAIHAWLRSGERPRVDCGFFVGAVEAALEAPRFSHRLRVGGRDLNRCFCGPFDDPTDPDARLAESALARIRALSPEALLDLHNTSGTGPAYGVATRMTDAHLSLAAAFTDHVILTDVRLGTLVEGLEDESWPALVVECGGARDPVAHEIASDGLRWFVTAESVLQRPPGGKTIHVLAHPVRVELAPGAGVAYGDTPAPDASLTLRPDVDQHNFGVVDAGTRIGWLPGRSLDALQARCTQGRDWVQHFFSLEGDELVLQRDLRLFMVTTNPAIARQDCLFYALSAEGD